MKVEKHRIAGTSYRQKEIVSLGYENPDYYLTESELIESGYENERIFQIEFGNPKATLEPEPDNKFDKNAVKVILDGVHVGYIKKGSCSHIKNLMKDSRIHEIEVDVHGGKYKYISYDAYEDKYNLDRGTSDFFVSIKIHCKETEPQNNNKQDDTTPNISNLGADLFLNKEELHRLDNDAFFKYSENVLSTAKECKPDENVNDYISIVKLIQEEVDRRKETRNDGRHHILEKSVKQKKNKFDEVRYDIENRCIIIGNGKRFSDKKLRVCSILMLTVAIFMILMGIALLPIGLVLIAMGIIEIALSVTYSKYRKNLLERIANKRC